ncbi:lipopolysaccharide biosynthesis protein [Reyranella sp.]|uniref:lipopolysaccharide biosynthesis protein n=1 Tax=Reyranella sp. TaxID=1929291 RepID=UPI003D11A2AC
MLRDAARDAMLVVGGRIGFVALWFLATLLIYRGLGSDAAGLSQAGLFAVTIACIKIASGCIVDPGDVALMRHAPGLMRSDPEAAYRLFRSAFWLRGVGTVAVVAVLLVFAPIFSRDVLGHPEATSLIRYVGAAIVGDMLIRSVMVVMQAAERFVAFVLVEGLMQVLRFGSIMLLWLLGAINVELVLACYAAASFAAVLVGVAWLPRGLFASARFDRADMVQLLHFLKWMMPAMMLAAFNERVDVLLVYGFSGSDAAGRYGAMLTLALVPDLVAGCLISLLQPRIARMREEGTYAARLHQFQWISLPAAAVTFVLAVSLAKPVIALLLGETYAESSGIFLWLLAGTLFWLAVAPLPMTMVAVHAPARIALVTLGQSAYVVLIGLLLLPSYGPIGMAFGIFVMRVGVAAVLHVTALRLAHTTDGEAALRQPRPHAP